MAKLYIQPEESFRLILRNKATFCIVWGINFLASVVLIYYMYDENSESLPPPFLIFLYLSLIFLLLSPIIFPLICYRLVKGLRRDQLFIEELEPGYIPFDQLIGKPFPSLGRSLLAAVVVLFIYVLFGLVAGGLVASLIELMGGFSSEWIAGGVFFVLLSSVCLLGGGVYLFLRLLFFKFLYLTEPLSLRKAFKRSWQATKTGKPSLLSAYLQYFLLGLILCFLLNLLAFLWPGDLPTEYMLPFSGLLIPSVSSFPAAVATFHTGLHGTLPMEDTLFPLGLFLAFVSLFETVLFAFYTIGFSLLVGRFLEAAAAEKLKNSLTAVSTRRLELEAAASEKLKNSLTGPT